MLGTIALKGFAWQNGNANQMAPGTYCTLAPFATNITTFSAAWIAAPCVLPESDVDRGRCTAWLAGSWFFCIRPKDLRIAEQAGLRGYGREVVVSGCRIVMDATLGNGPNIMLNLSLRSTEAVASGATIRLMPVDGWVIPKR
ncbi:MAG TPA: hypothetical protein VGL25_17035 [Casimicrobiaceae bacterium]|jgi:hypothetical protein